MDAEALIQQLGRYLEVPSPSGAEGEFLRLLEAELGARGFRIERQAIAPDRWNLLALPLDAPRLLFSTHVDVVPPQLVPRRDGDRIFGRGACDTKGGLVAMMAAAERLDPERRFIGFLLVVGEEVDHIGARRAGELDLSPEAIILCEPTTGHLVSGQKGILKLALRSEGVAAHSAFPELGRDALGPLLDCLQRLRGAAYPSDPHFGPTTLNIGILRAGVAANVTPALAEAEVLYRVVSDVAALEAQVRDLCGPAIGVAIEGVGPAIRLPVLPDFPTEVIAFNTDANHLMPLGPVYLMGPGDIRLAHGENEHITVDDLLQGVEDFVRLGRAALGE